ncbi:MAG: hypothetical protein OEW98_04160, partial [Betaproteobacteria bacterium]|nr:hypothetical protein [Betaproteobacteria bacterium]
RKQQADAGDIRTLLRAGDSRRGEGGKPLEKPAPWNHRPTGSTHKNIDCAIASPLSLVVSKWFMVGQV